MYLKCTENDLMANNASFDSQRSFSHQTSIAFLATKGLQMFDSTALYVVNDC